MKPSTPNPHPYATMIIPRLDGDEALPFVGLLKYIIQAVWIAHSDDMRGILEDDPRMYTRYAPPLSEVLRQAIPCTHEVSLRPTLDDNDLPF